jgi:hypothetical protein
MWRGGVGGNRYAQPTGSRVHPAPWLANRNAPRTPLTVSSATDPGACCHKPPPPHRCADPPAHLPIREVGQTSTGRSSLLIRRWRKQDSNRRSPSRGCRLILGEEKGRRSIRLSRKTPSFSRGTSGSNPSSSSDASATNCRDRAYTDRIATRSPQSCDANRARRGMCRLRRCLRAWKPRATAPPPARRSEACPPPPDRHLSSTMAYP